MYLLTTQLGFRFLWNLIVIHGLHYCLHIICQQCHFQVNTNSFLDEMLYSSDLLVTIENVGEVSDSVDNVGLYTIFVICNSYRPHALTCIFDSSLLSRRGPAGGRTGSCGGAGGRRATAVQMAQRCAPRLSFLLVLLGYGEPQTNVYLTEYYI